MLKKIIRFMSTILGLISGYIIGGIVTKISMFQEISFLSKPSGIITLDLFFI